MESVFITFRSCVVTGTWIFGLPLCSPSLRAPQVEDRMSICVLWSKQVSPPSRALTYCWLTAGTGKTISIKCQRRTVEHRRQHAETLLWAAVVCWDLVEGHSLACSCGQNLRNPACFEELTLYMSKELKTPGSTSLHSMFSLRLPQHKEGRVER